MTTRIPHIVLSEILENKSSPEIIAALLNAAEEKNSPTPKHWNSKFVFPFWKICENCNVPFMAMDRYQAVRKTTCSKLCKNAIIGKKNSGEKPVETHSGKSKATCAVCGTVFHRNTKWLARTKTPVCSRKCNGATRGQEWKAHAHKGRAAWSTESKASFHMKMRGEKNPFWRGGICYGNRKGKYLLQKIKYVTCPEGYRSMARKSGYVSEHRLVVAKTIGRNLTRIEVVHHINHDATDNRPENLMLFSSQSDHKAFENGRDIPPIWCGLCHFGMKAKSGACVCRPERLSLSGTE